MGASPGIGTIQLSASATNPAIVYQYIVGAGANTDLNGPGSQVIGGTRYSQAQIMTAIAGAESGYVQSQVGDQSLAPYGSPGWWQIFTGAHTPASVGLSGSSWNSTLQQELEQPGNNARAAMDVLGSGNNYHAWTTYWSTNGGVSDAGDGNGAFRAYLPFAVTASDNAADIAGPGIPGVQPPAPSTSPGPENNVSSSVAGDAGTAILGFFSGVGSWLKGGVERLVLFVGGGFLLLLVLWKLGGS